jgi:hypothetical protein
MSPMRAAFSAHIIQMISSKVKVIYIKYLYVFYFRAVIALSYSAGLRAGRSGFYGSIPGGAGNFSLHHRVQNGSGAHPASYPMGTRGSHPGGIAAGA